MNSIAMVEFERKLLEKHTAPETQKSAPKLQPITATGEQEELYTREGLVMGSFLLCGKKMVLVQRRSATTGKLECVAELDKTTINPFL